jgi:hypothetical protein
MTDAPRLSVVIPTFNSADVLATCQAEGSVTPESRGSK